MRIRLLYSSMKLPTASRAPSGIGRWCAFSRPPLPPLPALPEPEPAPEPEPEPELAPAPERLELRRRSALCSPPLPVPFAARGPPEEAAAEEEEEEGAPVKSTVEGMTGEADQASA